MNDGTDRVVALVRHFERVATTNMRGLPILNPRITVEAASVRPVDDHFICVLITPWFMNLVLLPGTDEWANLDQGDSCSIDMPGESLQGCVCRNAELGTYLTAVLFRTMSDFPDQATARAVAAETMRSLLAGDPDSGISAGATAGKPVSRRSLLTGLGTD